MKTKDFDCVEMKRKGAERVHAATKGMTVEEEVEYWRSRTEEARRWLAGESAAKYPEKTPDPQR
jgi:hypothetical protein